MKGKLSISYQRASCITCSTFLLQALNKQKSHSHWSVDDEDDVKTSSKYIYVGSSGGAGDASNSAAKSTKTLSRGRG